MEIRIGITNTARELNFESGQSAEAVAAAVASALESGQPAVTFTDVKGNTATVTIPNVMQSNGVIQVVNGVMMP